MRAVTTDRFRKEFDKLPEEVRLRSVEAYRLWLADPRHPSLHFRRIHPSELVFSARIGVHYRALALVEQDTANLVLDRIAFRLRQARQVFLN